MAKKKSTDIATISKDLKDVIANGIDQEAIKEKFQEYVKVSKLKTKIAREILGLTKESKKTRRYLDDLEKDMQDLGEEVEDLVDSDLDFNEEY